MKRRTVLSLTFLLSLVMLSGRAHAWGDAPSAKRQQADRLTTALGAISSRARSEQKQWRETRRTLLKLTRDRGLRDQLRAADVQENEIKIARVEEHAGRSKTLVLTRDGLRIDQWAPGERQGDPREQRVSMRKATVGWSLFPVHIPARDAARITQAEFGSVNAVEVLSTVATWSEQRAKKLGAEAR